MFFFSSFHLWVYCVVTQETEAGAYDMRHVSEVAQGVLWLDGKHLNQDVQGCPHMSQTVKDVTDSYTINFVFFVLF